MSEWKVFSESPSLLARFALAAERLRLNFAIESELTPSDRLCHLALSFPAAEVLAPLRGSGAILCALVARPDERDLAASFGHLVVTDVDAAASAMALFDAGRWSGHTRHLPDHDRAYLRHLDSGPTALVLANDDLLAWEDQRGHLLGTSLSVAAALQAHARKRHESLTTAPRVEDIDSKRVTEILHGPRRVLSDHASKLLLKHYDVAVAEDELCQSPSRAAAEASRLGYPVRLTLTSPDLRVWDHPEIVSGPLDNAARVREEFRRLSFHAEGHQAHARILGVTVARALPIRLALRAFAERVGDLVLFHIGFADAHGLASRDFVHVVLPCGPSELERALLGLTGHSLLLPSEKHARRLTLDELADLLLRVAALLFDHRNAIERIRLDPIVQLDTFGLEVRDAAIHVTDHFERLQRLP